jgi:TonB family protein
MNSKNILLAATLLGGLLSSASAAVAVAPLGLDGSGFVAPSPVKIVNPTGILRRYQAETIRVSLTVDAEGHARSVRLLSSGDAHLEKRLLPVIAKWEFAPAKKNGQPVSADIVLPIQLVDETSS